MKTLQDKFIIGVDHGYGNMKTANHCFRTGILGYDSKPLLDDRFYAVYTKLCEISNLTLNPEAEAALTAIFNDLRQNLFLPRKQTQREITEEVVLWQQQDSGQ